MDQQAITNILNSVNNQISAVLSNPNISPDTKRDLTSERQTLESMVRSFQESTARRNEDFIKDLQSKANSLMGKLTSAAGAQG